MNTDCLFTRSGMVRVFPGRGIQQYLPRHYAEAQPDFWLAEILGADPVFGFSRKFLQPARIKPSETGELVEWDIAGSGIFEVRSFLISEFGTTWAGFFSLSQHDGVRILTPENVYSHFQIKERT